MPPDSEVPASDAAPADAPPLDAPTPDAPMQLPQLGLYIVGVDGTGFRLLSDTGTQQLTHARRRAGTNWMTATRYHDDADGNGYAMELEAPFGAYYAGAEVVVFSLDAPSAITSVAGATPGKICANSSWTDDGKLLYLHQDHPTDPNLTVLERASFSTVPAVTSRDVVPTPPELLLPIDPHQIGPSDSTGSIVFPATFNNGSGWMRPVWRMPASGTTSLAAAPVVGCPICGSGCCAFPTPQDILGTNDPRMNHAGNEVIWMQQHPDVSFGAPPLHPQRQVRKVGSALQVDLTPSDIEDVTSLSFAEWRADDAEVVYWSIELEGTAVRQHLYRMAPDGTQRARIPIPDELCAQHPSYISPTEIVFSGWRCAGTPCSCQVERI